MLGAARSVIVRSAEAAPFTLTLTCDAGELVLVDMMGSVVDRDSSVSFDYPAESQLCHWLVDATGEWRISPE